MDIWECVGEREWKARSFRLIFSSLIWLCELIRTKAIYFNTLLSKCNWNDALFNQNIERQLCIKLRNRAENTLFFGSTRPNQSNEYKCSPCNWSGFFKFENGAIFVREHIDGCLQSPAHDCTVLTTEKNGMYWHLWNGCLVSPRPRLRLQNFPCVHSLCIAFMWFH